jgi:hypothetical protein
MAAIISVVARIWLQIVVASLFFTIFVWLFFLQRLNLVERGTHVYQIMKGVHFGQTWHGRGSK